MNFALSDVNMEYDIIVIGGGHAGCEAAHAAAKMGAKTALISMRGDRLAYMSCNPAIGGLAKGQIAREVDALGGLMGLVTDRAGIQFRMINTAKGPAVRSARVQCDRQLYARVMAELISQTENLALIEGEAVELLAENIPGENIAGHAGKKIKGIRLADGQELFARAVILTAGTFLRGIMHVGTKTEEGGRQGEMASNGISSSLEKLGIKLGRLKTGTPPRVDASTINFDKTVIQPGDEPPLPISFRTRKLELVQVPCYLTRTTEDSYQLISENKHLSPMFSGQISAIGPQYCPSIEDKINRFPNRRTHQVFLEPEGRNVPEVYLNGVSTSLPEDVQFKLVRSVIGLERAEILSYGYAIEYDYAFPTQLFASLESKLVAGLFCAGQVNGTSGYEEAAGQGLVAGINAVALVRGAKPLVLGRDEAYIGVLIDDLVTKGTDEPYRMFTSRAEFRLLLRHDNADRRLVKYAEKFGLLSPEYIETVMNKQTNIDALLNMMRKTFVDGKSLDRLLRQPEISFEQLLGFSADFEAVCGELKLFAGTEAYAGIIEALEIECKYAGYIGRAEAEIAKMEKTGKKQIPSDFDYSAISSLSKEARKKLSEIQPSTVAQASRVSGVTPADISVLLVALKGRQDKNSKK